MKFFIFELGAPNSASNKALLSSENSPNPLLDFSMTYLQNQYTSGKSGSCQKGLTNSNTMIGWLE